MTTDRGTPLFGELPPGHRSGYVGIVGRPNVGKSTLLNAVLGRKLAAVTPKPQTTRRRLLGIKTLPAAQILFVDTPGIHRASGLLNERMVECALQSLSASDAVLWMIDVGEGLAAGDREVAALLPAPPKPVVVALNKIDGHPKTVLLPLMAGATYKFWRDLRQGRTEAHSDLLATAVVVVLTGAGVLFGISVVAPNLLAAFGGK